MAKDAIMVTADGRFRSAAIWRAAFDDRVVPPRDIRLC